MRGWIQAEIQEALWSGLITLKRRSLVNRKIQAESFLGWDIKIENT